MCDNVVLLPANTKFDAGCVSEKIKSDIDFSVVVLSAPTVASQMKITAIDSESLAIEVFNSQWDCLLLGAIFNCDVMFYLQSDKPIEQACEARYINVTDYHLYGILNDVYQLSNEDEEWIKSNYNRAQKLLDNDLFRTAIHSMASYRWHSHPRVRLAIIWFGIEALFKIESEISFRLSLYVAKFLATNDRNKEKETFDKVKKLYNSRSAAVHGGKIKDDPNNLVSESASILNKLIRRCSELGHLPNTDKLLYE